MATVLLAGTLLACASRAATAPAPPVSDVCDLDRWKASTTPTPWTDSLVPERELDAPLSVVTTPVLAGSPPVGWAILGVAVNPRGRAEEATVMASSSPDVVEFARSTTIRSRFRPPLREGQAVWGFGCRLVELRGEIP